MKSSRNAWIVVLVVGGGLALAQSPQQRPPQPQPQGKQMQPHSRDAVLKDIERTVGFVPAFFREIAPAMLPGFWELMKNFQMGNTRLDAKTKELIGLAVASGIPCEYCIQFHSQVAKAHGASEQELEEAVGMGAMTRMGSTVLNGLQIDKAQFRRDLDRMGKTRQQARK
jgi:AhpD family alkylhydroperoxidase